MAKLYINSSFLLFCCVVNVHQNFIAQHYKYLQMNIYVGWGENRVNCKTKQLGVNL